MDALLLIDLQNDFTPATSNSPQGALAVADGNQVVAVANALMPCFDLVVAMQDWHPKGHLSFASQYPSKNIGDIITLQGLEQILWPDHCVQETPGADFLPDLDCEKIAYVVRKGTDQNIDSYSGFFDNGQQKTTELGTYLNQQGADKLYISGLATDYCVKFTVLDALELGFNTVVIQDGCRAVNLWPNDANKALEEMHAAGAKIINSSELTMTNTRTPHQKAGAIHQK